MLPILQAIYLRLLPLALNPSTGDANAKIMGFVIAALVLSALLIVVFFVLPKRGNNKRKKR